MLIAHRGVTSSVVKENTIPAFLGAINNSKYAGFEFDIYTSCDGEFVVHHDPLVDGKFIWKCSYKELKKKGLIKLEDVLKLKTPRFSFPLLRNASHGETHFLMEKNYFEIFQ